MKFEVTIYLLLVKKKKKSENKPYWRLSIIISYMKCSQLEIVVSFSLLVFIAVDYGAVLCWKDFVKYTSQI